jgi:hypothetical protein
MGTKTRSEKGTDEHGYASGETAKQLRWAAHIIVCRDAASCSTCGTTAQLAPCELDETRHVALADLLTRAELPADVASDVAQALRRHPDVWQSLVEDVADDHAGTPKAIGRACLAAHMRDVWSFVEEHRDCRAPVVDKPVAQVRPKRARGRAKPAQDGAGLFGGAK